ncbi:diguanylate cyclase domain-containing protein, partial [Enterobacter hormaechei]|uniref:diguanylate cyclase domain-containing protein n=1 Tax=Enterobacter hormaechei TaxID=158836 RepID=UPI001F0B1C91
EEHYFTLINLLSTFIMRYPGALFFDNQLATLLEDQEKVGTYGIVMMIRLPEFDLLRDNWGRAAAEEHYFTLINLLSTFIMRYPGALFFDNQLATLL